jgi:2-C-methyl-D-erythritol 4-phosphate cytidylyltransferase
MFEQQKVGAVIVAAGESRRMGGGDKMTAPLGKKTVLAKVLKTFQACLSIDEIVLVVLEKRLSEARLLAVQCCKKSVKVCPGGKRRQDSVKAGLNQLGQCDWVVIQDGARPLVTVDLIEQGLQAAKETGAAIAAVPVTDTIKMAEGEFVKETLPRQKLWAVQTPQVFRYNIIMEAYRKVTDEVTDDAALVEQSGHKVKLYMGAYRNIKITTPDDLIIAEALLKNGK